MCFVAVAATAQVSTEKDTLRTNTETVAVILDGKDMINSMLPYVAGEKEPFKLSRVDSSFPALRHMLYPADSFDIVYLPKNEKSPKTVTYPATDFE